MCWRGAPFFYLHSSYCKIACFQNLCVTAAHCPIREILEKEKKVCIFTHLDFQTLLPEFVTNLLLSSACIQIQ